MHAELKNNYIQIIFIKVYIIVVVLWCVIK